MSVDYKCTPHDGTEGPLPRPQRRRRRSKDDRGLPPDPELAKLAAVYLQTQGKLWPKLTTASLLPAPTDEVILEMVADFKQRHRGGAVEVEAVRPFAALGLKLGGNYNRYSCDNSNPNSIADQMVNALNKAHSEERFVPWTYVFADFSVTGTDAARRGYTSYKAVLGNPDHLIETTYIDDFTRASRDDLEWWKLAGTSKRLSKRMIGASDGFDLNGQLWEVQIALFGILSRLFLKGLREKVKRGMHGAARRRTCLGKQALGFTRHAQRDAQGLVIYGPDGRPTYEPCVDPVTRADRLLMYKLFVEKAWSPYEIARHFNEQKIDGWDGWTAAGVKKLLRNPTAIGVFIWNRTRREFDFETGKYVVVENPRCEWQVSYDRNLAIVPMELYRAARRKLAAARRTSPLTGRKPSRNEISATTLFSGTLFCEYCGAEIKLGRSTKQHKQLVCFNGLLKAHGCKLSASKSTRVVEECLLGFLRDTLFSKSQIEKLVHMANEHLKQEAKKPRVDVAPLQAKQRQTTLKMKRLVRLVEETEDKASCKAYHSRVAELQKEVDDLQVQIRDANVRNQRRKLKPLEAKKAEEYLADLPTTLKGEIPAAAEAIRMVTGKILIRQEARVGYKNRCRWIATFSPNLMEVLRHVLKDCPTSLLAEIQDSLGNETIEVALERIPKYEQLAATFKRLADDGASINSIASAHGMTWLEAKQTVHFANTGERPKFKSGKRTGTGCRPAKYLEIAPEVVKLRDKEKMSFDRIAAKLGVNVGTVSRAYDHGRPDAVREAAKQGKPPRRGSYSHLGASVFVKIRKLLLAGRKPADIAQEAGCGERTVYRVRKQMKAEKGKGHAA